MQIAKLARFHRITHDKKEKEKKIFGEKDLEKNVLTF